MTTTPRRHSLGMIALIAMGMLISPVIATAGEAPERGFKPKAARRAAPPRRADRPPAHDHDAHRGPHDAVTRPTPPRRAGQPPKGPLPEIAHRMLTGTPMDLFSDVMAKLLSDVAVKLMSENEAELLSGNQTGLLSGNETGLLSGNETGLLSGNETELLSGNEPELLSGNSAQLLSGNSVTLFSGNHITIEVSESGNNNGSQNAAGKEFSALDRDGNGQLSFSEFRARKMDRLARKAHKRFRRRDVNSDGGLTLQEFAALR